MDYTQLKQPNLAVVGQDGLCLAYVTDVFGVPNFYDSATDAWAAAQFPHTGEPPTNISVPIWFKYDGPDGHVAVWAGGTIYSTSAQGDKIFSSIEELCTWMGEGMTYLGWSEDINKVSVVEENMVVNPDGSAVTQAEFDDAATWKTAAVNFLNDTKNPDTIPALNQAANVYNDGVTWKADTVAFLTQLKLPLTPDSFAEIVTTVDNANAGVTVLQPGKYQVD